MRAINYRSMGDLIANYVVWSIGFESTHPNAEAILARFKQSIADNFGEDVLALCELSMYACCLEEAIDLQPAILAVDRLAVLQGRRPPGWVASNEKRTAMTFNGLDYLLDHWAGAERILALDQENGPGEADIKEFLDMLTERLPDFGDPEGQWVLTIEDDVSGEPHASFVPSSVTPDIYVNGKYVQWFCAQGRATAWQGTMAEAPYPSGPYEH
jgi:hypothetical protein